MEQWNIPDSYIFHYMQLSHTLTAQFPQGLPQPIESGLEQVVRIKSIKKPISVLYTHLLTVSLSGMRELRSRWERDIPELEEEDWGLLFQTSVSLQDKLTQFKITHRAYYTPYRLHKISPSNSQKCWSCGQVPGDFIHVFWICLDIAMFWAGVIDVIVAVTAVAL